VRVPYELYLALRYLRFHRGRKFLSVITLISLAGVTVGTAAMVIALALMAGTVQDMLARIYSGSAHLTVVSLETSDPFPGAEELIRELESVEGVEVAGPVLYTPALITFDDAVSQGFAELHGIDPAKHPRVILGQSGEATPYARLARPTTSGKAGIILGVELARKIGALEGDLVRVMVPRVTLAPWNVAPRTRVYEVVGTYRSDHFQEDALRAYIEVEQARSLLRAADGTSWVEMRVDDIRRLELLKGRIRGSIDASWRLVDLVEQNAALLRALNTEKLVLFLAIGLIVVVAALNIVSTLILMVNDKIREIGTLTAMGARSSGIAAVFMLQGLLIGLVGAVSGLMLGSGVAFWLHNYRVIKVDPEVYYLHFVPFVIQPIDLAVIGVGVLIVSLLATLYPALTAGKLDPVEAIRYE
jgi:lipoprotein-releasing system permease protein